jgi:hypothetical protein
MIYVLGRRHSLDCYFKATFKKIVKLGSNLRLTFLGDRGTLDLPRGGGARRQRRFHRHCIAAQVHTYYCTLPGRGPNRDKMFLSDADACAAARDHDRALPLRENLGMSFVPSPAPQRPKYPDIVSYGCVTPSNPAVEYSRRRRTIIIKSIGCV